MAEKEEQHKNKREGKKIGKLTLKEKRKKKKERKSTGDGFQKIKKTETEN